MKQICLLTCLSLLLMLSSCGGSDIGYAPMYRDAAPAAARAEQPEVVMQYTYYGTADSLHLILRFEELRQLLDLQQSASRIEYVIRSGGSERDALLFRDTLAITAQHRVPAEGTLVVPLRIPRGFAVVGNVMQVRLWLQSTGQARLGMSHKFALHPRMLQRDYQLLHTATGRPLVQGFVTTGDSLQLRRQGDTTGIASFAVLKADYNLQPALPPMSTRQEALPEVPRQTIDTAQYASGDTLSFSSEGLYLINPSMGIPKGLLVQDGAYPLVTRVQDMITPLIYLTTSAEREALYSAQDQKAAVDGFWLKIAKDKALARELIRTYYTRVEMANKLYTSFKPGWATDRGMIYIIYGKPSNVSVSGDSETWIYRESEAAPYVKFVFTKKENNFTENHFELTRNREYEENWYSTVARWRAGITNM
ncbi:GWxTD domain-containing protein [uncultured Pontibacter sp.]|uniref:GWxTD domain-containing protein n=1 Tax=uncultured Pontibacter sp. TaxID=453356 RepID=UPI0026273D7B|nr:GWxTD domain-containing protein [uncultured Pontibacter sp.]